MTRHKLSAQDPSRKTGQDTSLRTRHKQDNRTRHKLSGQDPSRRAGQDSSLRTRPKQESYRTRHKQEYRIQARKMYGSPSNGPSSSLNGPSSPLNGTNSPVYGENIDYAIRIVQHFINFLPGGKLFFLS